MQTADTGRPGRRGRRRVRSKSLVGLTAALTFASCGLRTPLDPDPLTATDEPAEPDPDPARGLDPAAPTAADPPTLPPAARGAAAAPDPGRSAPSTQVAAPETRIVIRPRERIVSVGDSLTAGVYHFHWLRRIEAAYPEGARPTGTISGIAGTGVLQIARDVQSRILEFDPTTVILQIGINDAASVPDALFEEQYRSILQQVRAARPDAQLVCVSLFAIGEDWPNGANPRDPLVNAKHERSKAAAQAEGCMWIDARRHFFEWESTHNPRHLSSGLLTTDGIHVNDEGRRWASSVLDQYTVLTY